MPGHQNKLWPLRSGSGAALERPGCDQAAIAGSSVPARERSYHYAGGIMDRCLLVSKERPYLAEADFQGQVRWDGPIFSKSCGQ